MQTYSQGQVKKHECGNDMQNHLNCMNNKTDIPSVDA